MRYLCCLGAAVCLYMGAGVPFSWANHAVGEPALEQLPIWQKCCEEQDCVPEEVTIMSKESSGMVAVEIEGVKTSVAKEKFSPVPSPHTWVCYYKPNAEIENNNIRCILYPQQNGTTKSQPRDSLRRAVVNELLSSQGACPIKAPYGEAPVRSPPRSEG